MEYNFPCQHIEICLYHFCNKGQQLSSCKIILCYLSLWCNHLALNVCLKRHYITLINTRLWWFQLIFVVHNTLCHASPIKYKAANIQLSRRYGSIPEISMIFCAWAYCNYPFWVLSHNAIKIIITLSSNYSQTLFNISWFQRVHHPWPW